MSNNNLVAMRARFYETMRDRHNTTNEEIARILKNANFESFKAEEMKLYDFTINAFFQALGDTKKEKIKEAAEQSTKEAKRNWGLSVIKEPIPCPIEDCEGVKVYYKNNGRDWKCSIGGGSHYIAFRTARVWKYVHPESELTIEEKATELLRGTENIFAEDKEKEQVE